MTEGGGRGNTTQRGAAKSADRPYQLSDLATGKAGAAEYFKALSLADLKSKCAMYGLKVNGQQASALRPVYPS